ncbi:MAG: DUF934 domain-containing protein [Granulosicoccus sp.]
MENAMLGRLLESNGVITDIADDQFSDAIDLIGGTDLRSVEASVRNSPELIVTFPSSADGRGFSLGAELREDSEFKGKLYATGKLNPDQISLAFQCGFDAIIVSDAQWQRYGEASWEQAIDPIVNKTYLRTHWRQLDPIWESRASTPRL